MRGISRTEFTAALIVIIVLALASIASSAPMPGHISTVEIYVDGFVCATCVRNIENTLKQEEGVAEVSGDWEKGIVAVTPDQNIGYVDDYRKLEKWPEWLQTE